MGILIDQFIGRKKNICHIAIIEYFSYRALREVIQSFL